MAVLFKYCFVVKINRIIPLFAVVARLLKRNDITTILIAASSAGELPEYDIIRLLLLFAETVNRGLLIPTNTTKPNFFAIPDSTILRELAATFTKLNRQG